MHLRDVSGFKDNFLSVLLEELHKEVLSHRGGSSLFVEGIAQSLAGHLVRTYADADTKEARVNNRLRRDWAFASGAQVIATDFPAPDPRFAGKRIELIDGEMTSWYGVRAIDGIGYLLRQAAAA